MAKVIKAVMFDKGHPALIFVNSGLKHETYDKLHYGTIRIFVDKSKKKELYQKFEQELENLGDKDSGGVNVNAYRHQVRRSIKSEFGTPRISGIIAYLKHSLRNNNAQYIY